MADSRRAHRVAGFPPPPEPDECHVWTLTGPELDASPDHLLSLLDPAEQARARRYRARSAYRLFVASRAAQRVLAARYLGRDPADVLVDRTCPHCGDDRHGRPRLAGVAGLDFSVAHTDGVLLIAYVGSGLVGVDVEATDRDPGADRLGRLADFALAPAEAALASALPEGLRAAAFHRLWTRKEAVLKLTGHGIAVPLRRIDVSADIPPGGPPGAPDGWPRCPIALTDLRLPAEPAHAGTDSPAGGTRPGGTAITLGAKASWDPMASSDIHASHAATASSDTEATPATETSLDAMPSGDTSASPAPATAASHDTGPPQATLDGDGAAGAPRRAAADVRHGTAGGSRRYTVAIATTDTRRRVVLRSAAPYLANPAH